MLLLIKETDIGYLCGRYTQYACGKDFDTISNKLELQTNIAIKWLKDNEMVANPSKFQLMLLSKYQNSEKKPYILMDKNLISIYKIFVMKPIARTKLFSA